MAYSLYTQYITKKVLISIIEFTVYGFITYASLLMLIISVVKETPSGKSQSILRAMWLIPGIITASLLAGMGDQVNFETTDITTTEVIINGSSGAAITNSTITTQETPKVFLVNSVWVTVHTMIFLSLLVYVVIQILTLLTKIN